MENKVILRDGVFVHEAEALCRELEQAGVPFELCQVSKEGAGIVESHRNNWSTALGTVVNYFNQGGLGVYLRILVLPEDLDRANVALAPKSTRFHMRFNRRKLVRLVLWGIVAALLAWGGAALAIRLLSNGRVFDSESISALPPLRAGVVLGCRKTFPNGLSNLYFTRRIAAAAELYKAGKVDCLIVSGDNHVKTYDEASDMKSSLVEAGVPEAQIVCDYAGFRTLDTVVRAKKVFGLDSFVIVSQSDHVRRAVFTARGFGCDAYGYAAQDVNGRYSIKTTIREQLAKIAAVLDVIFRRSPKFLGPREPLPGDKTLELPVAEHGDEQRCGRFG